MSKVLDSPSSKENGFCGKIFVITKIFFVENELTLVTIELFGINSFGFSLVLFNCKVIWPSLEESKDYYKNTVESNKANQCLCSPFNFIFIVGSDFLATF
jgi:hypothetical protein